MKNYETVRIDHITRSGQREVTTPTHKRSVLLIITCLVVVVRCNLSGYGKDKYIREGGQDITLFVPRCENHSMKSTSPHLIQREYSVYSCMYFFFTSIFPSSFQLLCYVMLRPANPSLRTSFFSASEVIRYRLHRSCHFELPFMDNSFYCYAIRILLKTKELRVIFRNI